MITTIGVAVCVSLLTYLALWIGFGCHPLQRNAREPVLPSALAHVMSILDERPGEWRVIGNQHISHDVLGIEIEVSEKTLGSGVSQIRTDTFKVSVRGGGFWKFSGHGDWGAEVEESWDRFLNWRVTNALNDRNDTIRVMEDSRARNR